MNFVKDVYFKLTIDRVAKEANYETGSSGIKSVSCSSPSHVTLASVTVMPEASAAA